MTAQRAEKIYKVLSHRQPDFTVVMENVHDPHNIAAVLRTCDSVGIQEVYVINTGIPAPKKFSKTTSASANKWLSIHQFDDPAKCFKVLREKGLRIFGTHLSTESVTLYDLDFLPPTALVFGNEHVGITEETLELCDGNFTIPQVGMIQSLNISVACAVSIYEGFRQRQTAGYYKESRMKEEEFLVLKTQWEQP